MFEQFSHMAERMATNLSRRQFLGRLGHTALSFAAIAAGLLAFSGVAKPGTLCSPNSSFYCLNHSVGDNCGAHSKCVVRKGTFNDCSCIRRGGSGGGPR